MSDVVREILLAFWKVHVLHHAAEGPLVGQWMLRELSHHGYEVSPGTLYPMLRRMEQRGWLRCYVRPGAGPRARKEYFLTEKGREVLDLVRNRLEELCSEVMHHGRSRSAGHTAKVRIPRDQRHYRLPSSGISLQKLERDLLRDALDIADGNQTRAARLLGISRDALRYRMQKFGFSN